MRYCFLLIMFLMCFMVGCSYKTPVNPVYGVNTYSTYTSKISGKYALIIKSDPNILDVDAHPSSAVGADAKFQISFSDSFATSVRILNEDIFSSIINADTIPSVEQMKQDKISGYILISSKFFEPDKKSVSGMFNTGVSATANIGFDYTIRNSDNEILLTGSVSSSRTTTAQGGAFGTTANDNIKVLQDAIQKALRDDLEQYAQRVTNDPKLRGIQKK